MKILKKLTVLSLCLLSTLTASAYAGSLERTDWELSKLITYSQGAIPKLERTLSLGFNQGMVYGFNGCNNFNSGYVQNERRATLTIKTNQMASTLMACMPQMDQVSKAFQLALQNTAQYKLTAKELTLLDKKGRALARFSKPITELPNTQWQVGSYNSGNALVSSLNSERMTAAFDKKGQLSGFSGCNQYFASYKIDPSQGTMQVGAVGSTKKMCVQPEDVMQEEQAFLSAWTRVRSYQRLGQDLTLFDHKGTRVLTFRLLK